MNRTVSIHTHTYTYIRIDRAVLRLTGGRCRPAYVYYTINSGYRLSYGRISRRKKLVRGVRTRSLAVSARPNTTGKYVRAERVLRARTKRGY